MKRLMVAIVGLVLGLGVVVTTAAAQYKREPESEIDPSLFSIDEKRFLGVRVDRSLSLLDERGQPFTLGEKMGQPLVMVLSYYQCDGTCSVVNADLKHLVEDLERLRLGEDFRVVTISFDTHDTLETVAKFRKQLGLPAAWDMAWTFSLAVGTEGLKRMTTASVSNTFGHRVIARFSTIACSWCCHQRAEWFDFCTV
ncbi:MAG: SCO1/SenC family protein [Rhodospirillaceae bacterium]|nr:MAG: SCO1/SenC family protein [Rhodospirillaceae bacterium]